MFFFPDRSQGTMVTFLLVLLLQGHPYVRIAMDYCNGLLQTNGPLLKKGAPADKDGHNQTKLETAGRKWRQPDKRKHNRKKESTIGKSGQNKNLGSNVTKMNNFF